MTSATTKQVVILCAMMFGCAAVAGATGLAPGVNKMSVTTASAADTLNLGISETLTTNVGQLPNGTWVNEIDVRLTSISGTYLGTDTIPSDASVVGFAGRWSSPAAGRIFPAPVRVEPEGLTRSTGRMLATRATPLRTLCQLYAVRRHRQSRLLGQRQ